MKTLSCFMPDLRTTLGEIRRRNILALGVCTVYGQKMVQVMCLDECEESALSLHGQVKVALTGYDPHKYKYVEYVAVNRGGRTLISGDAHFEDAVLGGLVAYVAPYLVSKFNPADAVADMLLATIGEQHRFLEGTREDMCFMQGYVCPRFLPYGGFVAAQGHTLFVHTPDGNWHECAVLSDEVAHINRVRHDGETYYLLVTLKKGGTERVDMVFSKNIIRCSMPYPGFHLKGIEAVITDSARQHSITIAVDGEVPIVRIRTSGTRLTRPLRVIMGFTPDGVVG